MGLSAGPRQQRRFRSFLIEAKQCNLKKGEKENHLLLKPFPPSMSGSEREGLTRTRSLFYNNRALDLEKVKSDLDAGFNDDADDDIEDASDLDDILASGKGSRGSKSKQRNRDTASSKKRNSSSEDLDPSLPAAPARKRSKLNGHPNDDLVDIEIEHDDDDVTVLNTSTKSKPREPAAATTASYLDFLTEKDLAMANSAARHGYGGGNLAGSAEALGYGFAGKK